MIASAQAMNATGSRDRLRASGRMAISTRKADAMTDFSDA